MHTLGPCIFFISYKLRGSGVTNKTKLNCVIDTGLAQVWKCEYSWSLAGFISPRKMSTDKSFWKDRSAGYDVMSWITASVRSLPCFPDEGTRMSVLVQHQSSCNLRVFWSFFIFFIKSFHPVCPHVTYIASLFIEKVMFTFCFLFLYYYFFNLPCHYIILLLSAISAFTNMLTFRRVQRREHLLWTSVHTGGRYVLSAVDATTAPHMGRFLGRHKLMLFCMNNWLCKWTLGATWPLYRK